MSFTKHNESTIKNKGFEYSVRSFVYETKEEADIDIERRNNLFAEQYGFYFKDYYKAFKGFDCDKTPCYVLYTCNDILQKDEMKVYPNQQHKLI